MQKHDVPKPAQLLRPCCAFEGPTNKERWNGKWIEVPAYPIFIFPADDWAFVWNRKGLDFNNIRYQVDARIHEREREWKRARLQQLEHYTQQAERRHGKVGQ